jgi:hypothetical protein
VVQEEKLLLVPHKNNFRKELCVMVKKLRLSEANTQRIDQVMTKKTIQNKLDEIRDDVFRRGTYRMDGVDHKIKSVRCTIEDVWDVPTKPGIWDILGYVDIRWDYDEDSDTVGTQDNFSFYYDPEKDVIIEKTDESKLRKRYGHRLKESERMLKEGNQEWFDKQLTTAKRYLTDIIDAAENARDQLSQYVTDVEDEVGISDDPERLLALAGNLIAKANRKLGQATELVNSSDVYFDLYYYKHGGTDDDI